MSGRAVRYLLASLGVVTGGAGMAAGEADDAPGLVLLGLLVVVGSVAFCVRSARRGR